MNDQDKKLIIICMSIIIFTFLALCIAVGIKNYKPDKLDKPPQVIKKDSLSKQELARRAILKSDAERDLRMVKQEESGRVSEPSNMSLSQRSSASFARIGDEYYYIDSMGKASRRPSILVPMDVKQRLDQQRVNAAFGL